MQIDSIHSNFKSFKLSPGLQKSLDLLNFTIPTPIQEKAIPVGLSGKDLIGMAATGTGKTMAFLIPLIEKLSNEKNTQACVLVPTRELAIQVEKVFNDITSNVKGLRSVLIVGGKSMYLQIKNLRNYPRVIIATPGRLLDHLGRNTLNLSDLSFLVLDEADRMLDIGFADQLEEIASYLPNDRQTLMFSATFDEAVKRVAHFYLTNPAMVSIESKVSKAKINERMIEVEAVDKFQKMLALVRDNFGSYLAFVNTKYRADKLSKFLIKNKIAATTIHGGLSQAKRIRALEDFKSKRAEVLVATDVASRGIDIDNIEYVLNFDIPKTKDDYTHRIGRTGRAGKEGEAITFVAKADLKLWKKIKEEKTKQPLVGTFKQKSKTNFRGGINILKRN